MHGMRFVVAGMLALAACGGNNNENIDAGMDRVLIDTAVVPTCAKPMGAPCGFEPQCDCPMNQMCIHQFTGSTLSSQCIPAGMGAAGAVCTTNADCAPATFCGAMLAGAPQRCLQYCRSGTDSDCAGLGTMSVCAFDIVSGMTQTPTGVSFCNVPCDAFVSDPRCNGANEACRADFLISGGYLPDCQPSNNETVGMACTQQNDCATGLRCHGTATANTVCHKLCDSTHMCDMGQVCAQNNTSSIGVCIANCTLFGTDCPMSQDCKFADLQEHGECTPTGTIADGMPCPNGDTDCVAGSFCLPFNQGANPECRKLCDSMHACPAAGACTAFRDNGTNLTGMNMVGYCPRP